MKEQFYFNEKGKMPANIISSPLKIIDKFFQPFLSICFTALINILKATLE
jgi:hypothetical protein